MICEQRKQKKRIDNTKRNANADGNGNENDHEHEDAKKCLFLSIDVTALTLYKKAGRTSYISSVHFKTQRIFRFFESKDVVFSSSSIHHYHSPTNIRPPPIIIDIIIIRNDGETLINTSRFCYHWWSII